jgi:dihydroorotase
MSMPLWLRQVDLLVGPDQKIDCCDALIDDQGCLALWGTAARERAEQLAIAPTEARGWLLAPSLVDPHSVLEAPWSQPTEDNLASLAASAAASGYGTVTLLPWASPWRDRPERLQGLAWQAPLRLKLWGSFSAEGADVELADHRDQIQAGAIGLATGHSHPPLALLERGLLLDEMGNLPILVAPRDAGLTAGGLVRESVETLRAGWPPDPKLSETLPLQTLLALAVERPGANLVLMNVSTAAGVAILQGLARPPKVTVSWWHLVADSGSLSPTDTGWSVVPSLGAPEDRQALISGLRQGLIQAIAVNHLALNAEEQLLPVDQRRRGLAGYGAQRGLVLPALWQELVEHHQWTASELWQVISWGPAELIGDSPEVLYPGTRRWILFDPNLESTWDMQSSLSPGVNQPLLGQTLRGQVRASGLTEPRHWLLSAPGSRSA